MSLFFFIFFSSLAVLRASMNSLREPFSHKAVWTIGFVPSY